jgi:putative addiction module CopG family antidote
MSKIEIELPPALAEFVQGQVDSGFFKSAEDVIEDAVRRAADEIWPSAEDKLEALRAALAPGVAEADAGIFFEGTIDDIIAEAKARRSKGK